MMSYESHQYRSKSGMREIPDLSKVAKTETAQNRGPTLQSKPH